MSILQHPEWPTLRPWLRVETYGRDTGPHGPRVRLEVVTPDDGIVLRRLLAISMPCVACGRPVHVVRSRAGIPRLYFAPTCALDVTYRCARGRAARQEYLAVRAAVERWQAGHAPAQPGLPL